MTFAPDNIEQKLKHLITSSYQPADSPSAGTIGLTTTEVFDKLQSIYSSDEYSPTEVAVWLEDLGFKVVNMGNLKLEWILKKK